jgi:hypothetical protein
MALGASDFENGSVNLGDTSTEKKDAAQGISPDEASQSLLAGHVETMRLRWLRFVFLFIFVATAVLVSSGMFHLIRQSERDTFDRTFVEQAEKVIHTVQLTVAQKVGFIEATSMTFTSYAVLKNDAWPFVTQPDFSIQAASARSLGQALSLELFPLVTSDNLAKWGAYAQQNSAGWMQDGLAFDARATKHNEEDQRALQTPTTQDTTISRFVYSVNENGEKVPSSNSAVFFPLWQSSPVNPGLVNYDLQSDERLTEVLRAVQISRNAVITEITDPKATDAADMKAPFQYWSASGDGSIQPISRIIFPVFDRLQVSGAPQVVAILVAAFHWEDVLQDILPPNSSPVVVVLENSCGQVHTYEINGEDAVYGGQGDLHDRRYDDSKRVSGMIFERLSEASSPTKKFQFVALDDRCSHKLYVYPTNAMEDDFISPTAWWFVGIIASVFVLASVLIFFYHWFVERRQKMVMRQAKQADNMVASIFPAAVRQRLFEGATEGPLPALLNSQKQRIKTFLEPGEDGTAMGTNGEPRDVINDKPMADLFPDVTIMFADISGFAAWSSQREPSDVFTLLQTLYHAFDKHARHLSVFKVETIGDCYVAATGLPSPQPDHAVRMARFAGKCMISMNELTRGLEVQLGPGKESI